MKREKQVNTGQNMWEVLVCTTINEVRLSVKSRLVRLL